MNDDITFSIVSKGEIKAGCSLEEVRDKFAKLFKISPEQAAKVVGRKTVIKKGLSQGKAELFKQRLTSIGMIVSIKSSQPVASSPELTLEPMKASNLSLEPIEGEADAQEPASAASPAAADDSPFSCPKCGLTQEKSSECKGCGIIFAKYNQQMAMSREEVATDPASSRMARARNVNSNQDSDYTEEENYADAIPPAAIGAGVAAAVVGALLWQGVALALDLEIGFLAWGIGGLVGFAVAKMGGVGEKAGIIAGVLALLSILGGKYLILDGIKDDLSDIMSAAMAEVDTEELQWMYQESLTAAKFYVEEVHTESQLKEFMVDYGYAEASAPSEVTSDDIAYFKEWAEPDLIAFAENQPSLDEWMQETLNTVGAGMSEMSTFDLMKEDFSWIDIIFYLLGISTAFGLANRGNAA